MRLNQALQIFCLLISVALISIWTDDRRLFHNEIFKISSNEETCSSGGLLVRSFRRF
jgi:hypothetical protein